MKLALYKGKGCIGNYLIRKWTSSKYSHCEIVIGDLCYSSSLMDCGVRAKKIDLKEENWDFIALPEYLIPSVLYYYEKTKDYSYSWLDLIRSQIFNKVQDQEYSSFCSEWCAAALGIPNPTIYNPRTLGELAKYLFETKRRVD